MQERFHQRRRDSAEGRGFASPPTCLTHCKRTPLSVTIEIPCPNGRRLDSLTRGWNHLMCSVLQHTVHYIHHGKEVQPRSAPSKDLTGKGFAIRCLVGAAGRKHEGVQKTDDPFWFLPLSAFYGRICTLPNQSTTQWHQYCNSLTLLGACTLGLLLLLGLGR